MLSLFTKLPRAATLLALAGALFTLGAPAAHAYVVVYNNLGSSRDGSDPVFSYGPLANSFNTGAKGAGYLGAVQLLLANGSTEVVGDIEVSLHADGANAPGAELVSLGQLSSANMSSTDFSIYTFLPVTAYQLAANTTYWVEIANLSANAIAWSWSTDMSAPGVAGQFSYSHELGKNANSPAWGPYQMAVTVPEPASLALVALGLVAAVGVGRRRKG